ncbi:MAG: aminotransferase class III-fold pyridoxal phosphate-dependent enzyme [Nitrospiraceae bacterium]|nr:aminotransferase class III-fold pyridoxal phosphate-dependent enzyme [Nitrospiraceae bacterium]
MKTYEYDQSAAWFQRAAKVIPCGVYGHFSPAPCVPITHYPFYTARAEGSKFWDVDGNEFIDYMCAYGPMILGYRNPIVDEAFQAQLKVADTSSTASPVMVELAEFMVDLIPVADWAFFAKNGADITNYAVTVARAATGRRKVIAVADEYHGSSPWMQEAGHHGVMDADHVDVIRVPWNDATALEQAFARHEGQVAAFIATPYHTPVFTDNALPAEGYWAQAEAVVRKNGAVLIVDDVRCGFRIDMGGSNEYFGFKPDLICFCKTIANGYPISALVGTDALRTDCAKVFHTGSFWFAAGCMAAALACMKEMKRIDAPKLTMEKGQKLVDGLVDIAKGHGYNLKVTGAPSMPYLRTTDDESLMFHQKLCGESTRRGAFFSSHHNWFLSCAHTDHDIQRTWDIFEDAFKAVLR